MKNFVKKLWLSKKFCQIMTDCITLLTYINIRSFPKISDGSQIDRSQVWNTLKVIPVAENMTDYSDWQSIERRINENLL